MRTLNIFGLNDVQVARRAASAWFAAISQARDPPSFFAPPFIAKRSPPDEPIQIGAF